MNLIGQRFTLGDMEYKVGDVYPHGEWGRGLCHYISFKGIGQPSHDDDGESNWQQDYMSAVAIRKMIEKADKQEEREAAEREKGPLAPWKRALLEKLPGWKEFCEQL